MRCVCCGRLVRMDSSLIPHTFKRRHAIDVRIQEFTGNGQQGPGTGFLWTGRELREDELLELSRSINTVAERVQQKLNGVEDSFGVTEDDINEPSLSYRTFQSLAGDYLLEAERSLETARMELEFRHKEVELAAKRFKG